MDDKHIENKEELQSGANEEQNVSLRTYTPQEKLR